MTADRNSSAEQETISLPIEWHTPDNIVTSFVNNVVVQHDERSFFISFFEIVPPIALGEGADEAIKAWKSIKAKCVARVAIARDQMENVIEALTKNLEKFKSRMSKMPSDEKIGG